MSYHFFGDAEDEILEEAAKQKRAEDVVYAATSPLNYVAKNGVKFIVGKKPGIVKEEDYIKALIVKTLKQNGIIGDLLDQRIKRLVEEVIAERMAPHPQWYGSLPRK